MLLCVCLYIYILIIICLVAHESVMSVVFFECRVLGNMTFWFQTLYYLGLGKMASFYVRCIFVFLIKTHKYETIC